MHTFQYNSYASWSLPKSNAEPCRMNLMLEVPVEESSNEISMTSGRYMQQSSISSTRAVAWIWAGRRCEGAPNIMKARVSFSTNSWRCRISATWRVIYDIPSINNINPERERKKRNMPPIQKKNIHGGPKEN